MSAGRRRGAAPVTLQPPPPLAKTRVRTRARFDYLWDRYIRDFLLIGIGFSGIAFGVAILLEMGGQL